MTPAIHILTNIRFYHIAGIAQSLLSFIQYLEHSGVGAHLVGVDFIRTGEQQSLDLVKRLKSFTPYIQTLDFPNIKQVMQSSRNLHEVAEALKDLINAYGEAIDREKPDLVLINGTYFLPWCLMQAAAARGVPMALHYHGVLTKETSGWDKKSRQLFLEMERDFDRKDLFYIFPSALTKKTVEEEVFGHPIERAVIVPNPVPSHFFKAVPKKTKKTNVGLVSRWTNVKNPRFFAALARHNANNGRLLNLHAVTDLKNHSKDRKNLKELVSFKRPMHSDRLSDFYASMDVIVCPSTFETYGNVAQEAVASGTPALISENMGVAETFRKLGLDEYIINFSSPKRVSEKIREIKGRRIDPSVRRRMRKELSPDLLHRALLDALYAARGKAA